MSALAAWPSTNFPTATREHALAGNSCEEESIQQHQHAKNNEESVRACPVSLVNLLPSYHGTQAPQHSKTQQAAQPTTHKSRRPLFKSFGSHEGDVRVSTTSRYTAPRKSPNPFVAT